MKDYALITGASKGIGKSVACLLAQKNYNLLLIARSETGLGQLAENIKAEYGVDVLYLVLDLSVSGAAQQASEWCKSLKVPICVLVNNAGYGLWGDFELSEISEQLNMLSLNINTVVELTYYLLPILKNNQQSYILNVSSTAAYQAIPTFSVYAASKAFVLSFSRALHYELKNTPVSVSCVSPGPTDTSFAHRAGLDAIADLAEKFNMSPETVARIALREMFLKKTEIVPGLLNRLSSFAARHMPRILVERISANLYKH